MFGPLGLPEILLILGLALLIFGPRRLPEMGRTLGRAMGEFRRASNDLKRTIQFEMDAEDERQEEEKRRATSTAALPPSTIAQPAGEEPVPEPGAGTTGEPPEAVSSSDRRD